MANYIKDISKMIRNKAKVTKNTPVVMSTLVILSQENHKASVVIFGPMAKCTKENGSMAFDRGREPGKESKMIVM